MTTNYPKIMETVNARQPEIQTLISFLDEVNQRTEKNIAGLTESINKLMPNPANGANPDMQEKSNLSGAVGDLHDLITRANVNCMRLDNLNAHFRQII